MFVIITHAATLILVHTALKPTELKSIETTGSLMPTSSYETCCAKPHSKCMIVLLAHDIATVRDCHYGMYTHVLIVSPS